MGEKIIFLAPPRNQIPVFQPIARHYTDSAIPTPITMFRACKKDGYNMNIVKGITIKI
jgi:hypothetical protein